MTASAPRAGRHVETAHGVADASTPHARLADRLLVASILVLALVHGLMYATLMPPWGLVDEEQHLHYIQSLSEQRRIPVAHRDLLSPEIVESLFAVSRWEIVLHQPPPASPLPADMGLEAYSYEGYQPPLYYALLAPVYGALPQDIFGKLYALRWLTAGLSLLTVYVAFRCSRELFPHEAALPYGVALLIAVLPERAMTIGRVNNDALVEVLAAALLWAAIRAYRRGLDPRRGALLGALFGLGMWAKATMGALAAVLLYLLIARSPRRSIARNALAMGAAAAALILPLVARNLTVYGDLTGFRGFGDLMVTVGGFHPPTLSFASVARAAGDSVAHWWFVWWKGGAVASNPFTRMVYGGLFLVMAAGMLGLVRRLSDHGQGEGRNDLRFAGLLFALGPLYAVLAMVSLFRGQVPVIQGRFLLPALVPCTMGLVLGLWRLRWGPWILGAAVIVLAATSGILLFGNLLPHAYFWSAVVGGAVPLPEGGPSPSLVWSVAYPRFLADKPEALRPALTLVPVLYAASLAGVAAAVRFRRKAHHHAA